MSHLPQELVDDEVDACEALLNTYLAASSSVLPSDDTETSNQSSTTRDDSMFRDESDSYNSTASIHRSDGAPSAGGATQAALASEEYGFTNIDATNPEVAPVFESASRRRRNGAARATPQAITRHPNPEPPSARSPQSSQPQITGSHYRTPRRPLADAAPSRDNPITSSTRMNDDSMTSSAITDSNAEILTTAVLNASSATSTHAGHRNVVPPIHQQQAVGGMYAGTTGVLFGGDTTTPEVQFVSESGPTCSRSGDAQAASCAVTRPPNPEVRSAHPPEFSPSSSYQKAGSYPYGAPGQTLPSGFGQSNINASTSASSGNAKPEINSKTTSSAARISAPQAVTLAHRNMGGLSSQQPPQTPQVLDINVASTIRAVPDRGTHTANAKNLRGGNSDTPDVEFLSESVSGHTRSRSSVAPAAAPPAARERPHPTAPPASRREFPSPLHPLPAGSHLYGAPGRSPAQAMPSHFGQPNNNTSSSGGSLNARPEINASATHPAARISAPQAVTLARRNMGGLSSQQQPQTPQALASNAVSTTRTVPDRGTRTTNARISREGNADTPDVEFVSESVSGHKRSRSSAAPAAASPVAREWPNPTAPSASRPEFPSPLQPQAAARQPPRAQAAPQPPHPSPATRSTNSSLEAERWTADIKTDQCVYCLECANGKYYVGQCQTARFAIRWAEHVSQSGDGAKWTTLHKPVRIIEVRKWESPVDEDYMVKRYMIAKGIDNVRGGTHSQVSLPEESRRTLESELMHAEGRCFACGQTTHVARNCPNKSARFRNAVFPYFAPKAAHLEKVLHGSRSRWIRDYYSDYSDYSDTESEDSYELDLCFLCGSPSHWAKDCRRASYGSPPPDPFSDGWGQHRSTRRFSARGRDHRYAASDGCYVCGSPSHWANDCHRASYDSPPPNPFRDGWGHTPPRRFSARGRDHRFDTSDGCYVCGSPSHWANDCPHADY